jgi:hypothetical protein
MAILSIKRDYGVNPSIVRMTTSDDYATMTASGYLSSQMPAFNSINGGAFDFNASDMILCYYPAGWAWFTLNSTETTLVAYTNGLPTVVNSSVLVSDQTGALAWDGPLTNGQIIIGSSGAQPVASTLTAGSNVTITNAAGAITIAASGGSTFPWSNQATGFTAAVNNGYVITAALTATLPSGSVAGQTIQFIVDTAGALVIQAAGGQFIRLGSALSAANGTATSAARGDCITLVYSTSSTTWIANSAVGGSWSIV